MPAKMARSIDDDIGQTLVAGFQGMSLDSDIARQVRSGRLGGVILFRRNLGGLPEVRALNDEIHALRSDCPPMIAVDQEGGRVQRLRAPFPELPPMRRLGEVGRKSLAHLAGRVLGRGLRVIGFDQNYAPVLDVDSNPDNPVIGDRAFSSDPQLVSRLGAAFVDGMQEEGVAACAKHFPGHGDTDLDSHLALPRIEHDRERLEAIEWPPFRAAARADVASIMTAHVVFTTLDPDLPATLSPKVLRPTLREAIGYDGVIVSDDLEMRSIRDHHEVPDAAIAALAAGCDQVLICHHPEEVDRAFEALVGAVEDGTLSREQIARSADRVRALKERYVRVDVAPADIEAALPHEDYAGLLADLGDGSMIAGADPTEYDLSS